MAITPKKRFSVLQRDGFQCKYCGQKPPFVQLEVDHILSKAEGGGDELDNLVSCCSVCNIGKGKERLLESNPNLWKMKITDTREKIRKEFTKLWNERHLGSIDSKTFVLLLTHIKHHTKDLITIYMHYGEEHDSISKFIKEMGGKKYDTEGNFNIFECKFKEGGEYCDGHLKFVFDCFFDYNGYSGSLFNVIEEVCGDTWTSGKEKWEEEYSSKLNYCLTESLSDYPEYDFLLRKYTLHAHKLTK